MKRQISASKRGFTLMEMLIVVTIIGILAAIILPRFIVSTNSAKASVYQAEKQAINSQLELFYFLEGEYPDGFGENADWGDNYADYWPEGVPTSDVYGVEWDTRYDKNVGRLID